MKKNIAAKDVEVGMLITVYNDKLKVSHLDIADDEVFIDFEDGSDVRLGLEDEVEITLE